MALHEEVIPIPFATLENVKLLLNLYLSSAYSDCIKIIDTEESHFVALDVYYVNIFVHNDET